MSEREKRLIEMLEKDKQMIINGEMSVDIMFDKIYIYGQWSHVATKENMWEFFSLVEDRKHFLINNIKKLMKK